MCGRNINHENNFSTFCHYSWYHRSGFAVRRSHFIGVTGKKVPLFSNIRVDIILVVILGMAICSQGGIGRIAATGMWSHPLSILGKFSVA